MKLIETAARTALLIRVSEWHDKALAIIVCTIILLLFEPDPKQHLGLVIAIGLFAAFLGSYGYALNSYCDRLQDRRVGRRQIVAAFSDTEYRVTIGVSACGTVATLLVLSDMAVIALGLVTLLLASLYSIRPARLKERGLLGIAAGALTQRLLPFLMAGLSLNSANVATGYLAVWLSAVGLATMMAHQLDDIENDKVAGVRTWALQVGRDRATRMTAWAASLVILYTFAAIPLFGALTGSAMVVTLLLLYAKQMIWIGEILFKSNRFLRFQREETSSPPNLPADANRITDPASLGRDFLIDRIRSGTLATRAPEHCPHKDWDWMGEPYLALNTVIAVGEYLDDSDSSDLRNRILQLQEQGAWDYTNGGRGADADTTASAIRTLDRLGHRAELTGLLSFQDPVTGLFNTFRMPGKNLGLCLPPQSRERHFGAHPCVLANVWLLLHERGQLGKIDTGLLNRIRGRDGMWASYFYPSPCYSTRMYAELLTAMGDRYHHLLEPTLEALLTWEPTPSSTQNAEIALSLYHLGQCFANRRDEIRTRAELLITSLKSAQLCDGSWPGETIWEFAHRSHPDSVSGYDCFRIHSTSLCVNALSQWEQH